MLLPFQGNHHLTEDTVNDHGQLNGLRAMHTIIIVICILNVIGNGILLVTLCYHRKLRTSTNLLIMSLAGADLLFGMSGLSLFLVAQFFLVTPQTEYICLILNCIISFNVLISVLSLMLLMAERYVSIVYPLKHIILSRRRYVLAAITIVWVYSLIYATLPLFGVNNLHLHNYYYSKNETTLANSTLQNIHCQASVVMTKPYMIVLHVGHLVPSCIAFPVLMTHSIVKVRLFIRRRLSETTATRHSCPEVTNKYNMRASQLIVILVTYFMLSWTPMVIWILSTTEGFTKDNWTVNEMNNTARIFYDCTVILGAMNSAVNPLIYGLGNVKIRHAVCQMFKKNIHGTGSAPSRDRSHHENCH